LNVRAVNRFSRSISMITERAGGYILTTTDGKENTTITTDSGSILIQAFKLVKLKNYYYEKGKYGKDGNIRNAFVRAYYAANIKGAG
jgi:hypothetical protein